MRNVLIVSVQLLIWAAWINIGASGMCLAGPMPGSEQRKVIKDPAESKAYISASNTTDFLEKGAAMEAFVARYPASVFKSDALQEAMDSYQLGGNIPKVEETAKRLLSVDDSNVRALMVLTFVSRSQLADADVTKLDDLCTSSRKGIAVLPRWQKPEGMADANFVAMKSGMSEIFYGGAGFCALSHNSYDVARDNYLKALAINPEDMANNYQLAIADLESSPSDSDGFRYLAKALHLAKEQHDRAAAASIEQYGMSKYKKNTGNDDGWDSFVAASTHAAPPPAPNKTDSTAAEIACQTLKQNTVDELSFSDWEFVLQQRDASPCNIEAADKVWNAIQEKGKHGTAMVQLPVKVISSSRNKLSVAVTEENQNASQVDLVITMEQPLANPPVAGARVTVLGIFTGYQLSPFFFSMAQGRLARAEPERN
ncbi:MAG: hypothetical protein JWN42_1127 [Candidatus Angelobacter sp.]|nr:hypothetical protein [Candidatus Angelobacter sp.]